MMEALFRAEAWGFMLQPVSPDNEAAVCQSMVEGCRSALSAYETTIDEDLRLLGSGEVEEGSVEQMAVLVRSRSYVNTSRPVTSFTGALYVLGTSLYSPVGVQHS